jgi:DHA2 family multidrug resistance protein-like MFS transporter
MHDNGVRKWWALCALALAVIAVGMDMTVLNVALPTLASTLHASASQLQWFSVSFTLVIATGLLIGGLFGDRFGRKKMLLIGLVIFGAGSLASAYAPSPAALIAAQAVLGLGAAFIVPVSMSVLTVLYTDQERPRAVAIWAGASFISLPIGPILGGWLLTNYWWGWVFLVNVPIVVLAIIAVIVLLPESRSAKRPQFDPLGILTAGAGLVGLIYGLIQAGQYGWGDTGALSFIAAGLVVLAVFALWERWLSKRPNSQPAVNPSLFRSASYTWGTILLAVAFFTFYSMLYVAPQYFQAIMATDALGSGLRLLPLIGGLLVGAILSQRIASGVGRKITVASGFLLMTVGLFIGANTTVTSNNTFIAVWTAVFGLGMGSVLATASSAALDELSPEQSGVGSALMQMFQRAAGPIGIAILGSILNSTYRGQLNVDGLPSAAADSAKKSVFAALQVAQKLGSKLLAESAQISFSHGMDLMLWVCGGAAIVGVILSLYFLPHRAAVGRHVDERKGKIEQ